MKFYLIFSLSIIFVNTSLSQPCYDAYDKMFTDENASLSYNEFHKLELDFLKNLNGCEAIDFSVISIDDNELILSALKGKVVVLNFWFTTCLPCLKEIPELNKLVEQNDSDEVVFIGFARDNKEKLDNFFDKFGVFNYNIIPESYAIADKYKVVAWPQSIVIDSKGKIYKSWAGMDESPEELIVEIQKAIDECVNYHCNL